MVLQKDLLTFTLRQGCLLLCRSRWPRTGAKNPLCSASSLIAFVGAKTVHAPPGKVDMGEAAGVSFAKSPYRQLKVVMTDRPCRHPRPVPHLVISRPAFDSWESCSDHENFTTLVFSRTFNLYIFYKTTVKRPSACRGDSDRKLYQKAHIDLPDHVQ